MVNSMGNLSGSSEIQEAKGSFFPPLTYRLSDLRTMKTQSLRNETLGSHTFDS